MATSFPGDAGFATTQWSMVLDARRSAPEARQALAELCQRYWYPLYVYVRRRVPEVHEARDLTQEFFAHLLEKQTLHHADPARGRFRSFLLTALHHFLANQWHKARARKRGGGKAVLRLDFDDAPPHASLEPTHQLTPEKLFDRQWALALLDLVLTRLRLEHEAAGRAKLFEQLKQFLMGESPEATYLQAAAALGMSAGTLRVAAHRFRKRYRELLRQEVAQTVADEAEIEDEIRALFAACTD